jgi:hypothetical protein
MDQLNRGIASSERCKGYAGRAESISLGRDVDPDGLMQSAAFNPRELYSDGDMKFSLLSRSCLNHGITSALTWILDVIDRSISKPSSHPSCERTT